MLWKVRNFLFPCPFNILLLVFSNVLHYFLLKNTLFSFCLFVSSCCQYHLSSNVYFVHVFLPFVCLFSIYPSVCLYICQSLGLSVSLRKKTYFKSQFVCTVSSAGICFHSEGPQTKHCWKYFHKKMFRKQTLYFKAHKNSNRYNLE